MAALIMKPVVDLYRQCSLLTNMDAMKRGGRAASDNCNKRATTAVVSPDNNYLPRCDEHRGIVTLVTGPVWENMPVRED